MSRADGRSSGAGAAWSRPHSWFNACGQHVGGLSSHAQSLKALRRRINRHITRPEPLGARRF